MKKILLALGIVAVAVGIAVPVALAAPGATVKNACPTGVDVIDPITTLPACQFTFRDGNGNWNLYNPTTFNDVQTPSGNENEHFEGTIANDTGLEVIYTTDTPLTEGLTCYSFVTHHFTPDWQLTISASGAYTLDCHFSK